MDVVLKSFFQLFRSHLFSVLLLLVATFRVWKWGADSAFPLIFHENPAFRTVFHRFPESRSLISYPDLTVEDLGTGLLITWQFQLYNHCLGHSVVCFHRRHY